MNNTKTMWGVIGFTLLLALIAVVGGNNQSSQDSSFGTTGTRFPNGITTSASTVTGTSTVGSSPDGFTLWSAYTVSTTSPVRASLTNTGTALVCNGKSLTVYSKGVAYAPSYFYVLGTSTSATAYSANLLGSTTVATSSVATNQVYGGVAPAWNFELPNNSSINFSVGDNMTNASSTFYGDISGEVSAFCWTTGQ